MNLSLDLEPVLTLNTDYRTPKKFIVIGAGGTGGYLIPNLARQISITNGLRRIEELEEHSLLIVDADTVSPKNLNRQNFIEKDLERNKAEVLATRYGVAFSTDIQFLDEYITSAEMLRDIVQGMQSRGGFIPVIVDCCDNNATRVLIHEAIQLLKKDTDYLYSLSSGNELYTGQVVCGMVLGDRLKVYETYDNHEIFRTPTVADMFPEILEGGDKLPTEMSCDEAAISHPQNIMTNITAGNLLFNFANTLLTADIHNENNPGLNYFAVTFDTQNGNFRTFFNKESVIKQYID